MRKADRQDKRERGEEDKSPEMEPPGNCHYYHHDHHGHHSRHRDEHHHLESVSFAHFWDREEKDCGQYANLYEDN